jgi:hypothetical protein
MPSIIGNQIDKICNIEFHPGSGHSRGFTDALYESARGVQGEPLTYLAAKRLMEVVHRGEIVLIVTGTGIDQWVPEGETDGPIGCAALARALNRAFDSKAVVICEDAMLKPMRATLMAAGEYVYTEELFFKLKDKTTIVEPFPLGKEAGRKRAVELIDKYKPVAVIFIERLGPNEEGIIHFVTGTVSSPEEMSYGHFIAEEAKTRGILTIGIGDGGNEVGFGMIYEDVKRITTFGSKCKCPCGKGVATVTATDVLIAAAVSNWGAYGIAAMLAFLKKDVSILHDEEIERRMIETCTINGCLDGMYMKPVPSVDGVSLKANQAIITLMHEVVVNGLMNFERAF